MIRCEFVDPLSEPRWDQWITEVPGASFFHSSPWARVLTQSYNYPLHYAVMRDPDERICGILPVAEIRSWWTGRRGVCLPFSDECSPLATDPSRLNSLVQAFRDLGRQRRWDYLELRGGAETLPDAVPSDEFLTHRVPMEATEELQFRKLKQSHQRNIRKAQREGVEIHRLRTAEALEAYYTLHCLTRKRHGVPPQPPHFFRAIQRNVIEAGHGFISLARFGGQWIAGAVYFEFGSGALYKFGASDQAFLHLRANNLLMWEAIQSFRARGFQELSLGRTDPHNSGLLQFKRGWGAQEIQALYHRVQLCSPLQPSKLKTPSQGLGHKILTRLPLPLLRQIGRIAYKHFG